MASIVIVPLSTCLSCLRLGARRRLVPEIACHQTRGKKMVARGINRNLEVLWKGSRSGPVREVRSVKPGYMRNVLFPRGLAMYSTPESIAEFQVQAARRDAQKLAEAVASKKRREKIEAMEKAERKQEESKLDRGAKSAHLELLTPENTIGILTSLLPSSISFQRSPIIINTPPRRTSPSIPITSAVSADALVVKEPETRSRTGIYGSVTTLDIVSAMKEILGQTEEGKRVALSPDNISFVNTPEEQDRVKHLGDFDINISIEGARPLRKTIAITAQS